MPDTRTSDLDLPPQEVQELRRSIAGLHLRIHNAPPAVRSQVENALERLSDALLELQEGAGAPHPAAGPAEAGYRELFEEAPDAYLATDAAGTILAANRAAERLFGEPATRLVGTSLARLLPAAERRAFRAGTLRRVRAGRTEVELLVAPRDGAPVRVSCSVAGGAGGTLRWIVRRARPRAEEGPERTDWTLLEALSRQISDAVVVVDAAGRVLHRSHGEESVDLLPLAVGATLGECAARVRALRPDGSPLPLEEWPPVRVLAGAGAVVDEEVVLPREGGDARTLLLGARPVHAAGGEVVAAIVTYRDVTEQRVRERQTAFLTEVGEILSSSLDYQATVQRLAQLCARSLGDFCVVHVAERERVRAQGIAHRDPEREEVVRGILRRLTLDPGGASPVAAVLRTGRSCLLPVIDDQVLTELAGGNPEDRERMRQLRMSSALIVPLRARGRTLGTISLARADDAPTYTEADQALAEELARRAALAVDNARLFRGAQREAEARALMLGVVSHDLRNSLNAALMNADLLLDIAPAFDPGTPSRRQMEALRRSLDLMHRLVQDLLDADNIASGRLSLHPALLPVRFLGQELAEMFGVLAAERQVRLEFDFAEDLPDVRGDGDRVVQVFTNLISNALSFTPAGGTVRVGAERDGEHVLFRVTDTGPGIAPEEVPRIFDRYWKSTVHQSGGSGLGLAIARGLVQAHGGEIWVESTLGEGSTFAFRLPGVAATR